MQLHRTEIWLKSLKNWGFFSPQNEKAGRSFKAMLLPWSHLGSKFSSHTLLYLDHCSWSQDAHHLQASSSCSRQKKERRCNGKRHRPVESFFFLLKFKKFFLTTAHGVWDCSSQPDWTHGLYWKSRVLIPKLPGKSQGGSFCQSSSGFPRSLIREASVYMVKVRVKSRDVPLAARELKRFTVLNAYNVTLKIEVMSVREKEKQEYGTYNWQSQPHIG